MEPETQKENPTEGMSVTEKRKYFEREIQHHATGAPRKGPTKQFSYLADHEVERMKQEDEQKASNMSHEELLEYMSPDQETEFNQVLASIDPRMKSLDDAALRAKAVIDKAHELSQNMSIEEAKQKANQFSTLDIAFADADSSEETGTTQNGESGHMVEVTKKQIYELKLEDGETHQRFSSNDSRR